MTFFIVEKKLFLPNATDIPDTDNTDILDTDMH